MAIEAACTKTRPTAVHNKQLLPAVRHASSTYSDYYYYYYYYHYYYYYYYHHYHYHYHYHY